MGDKKGNAKGVSPHLILFLALVFLTGGCLFLPVPHKRQHIYATQGTVIGSDTGKPVAGAKVTVAAGRYTQETVTDSDGHFAVDGEQGWHMIAWIATPSSGSLLPTHIDFEDGCLHVVVISAAGRIGIEELTAKVTEMVSKLPPTILHDTADSGVAVFNFEEEIF